MPLLLDHPQAYGSFGEVKEAIQAATLWNYIYTPAGVNCHSRTRPQHAVCGHSMSSVTTADTVQLRAE